MLTLINTPRFNHSKTQKCFLCHVIPYGTVYQVHLKIAIASLHSKNKLIATSWHPNLKKFIIIKVNSSKLII